MKKIVMSVCIGVVAVSSVFCFQKVFNSHNFVDNFKDYPEIEEKETKAVDLSVEKEDEVNENIDITDNDSNLSSTNDIEINNQVDSTTKKNISTTSTNTTISTPDSKNQNNNSNVINSTTNNENNKTTTTNSSSETNNNNSESTTNNENNSTNQTNKTEITKVSTVLYEQVTHGKKEFSSESDATARGAEIMEKELDYVIEYNATHEDQIQPDIINFRIYPSVIDENDKTWYYLHFICHSGHGNDEKLKSMY